VDGFTFDRTLRPVEVRPVRLFDIGKPVVVHVEHARAEFDADAIPGAEVLVDPNFHTTKIPSSGFLLSFFIMVGLAFG
jgi:hypothetical protein